MLKSASLESHTLSNGIPVYLQDLPGEVAAFYWWNQVGSCDEQPHEAGFAHFLEHMLFKDAGAKETGQASSGALARAIESLGGDINAYTSFDQTVYHVTCAAEHLERVLDPFGGMAKPQKFLKSDFTREREVILEELRKNEDAPGRQLFQRVFSSTFKKHPYGRPVIGFTRTLNKATVQTLEAFYRRNYVPQKMGLIVVAPWGDGAAGVRRRARVLALLEKRFGARTIPKPKKTTKLRTPVEPEERATITTEILPFDVQTPSAVLAFRVPDIRHEDVPGLDLLASILGTGELGRLYQRLFYKESLVTEVSAGLYVPLAPGMMYFSIDVAELERLKPAVEALCDELLRLQTPEGKITPDELKRVMTQAEAERLYATQSADGFASRLGFLHLTVEDAAFDSRYLDALRSVTPEKLSELARRYFNPRRGSWVVMVPKAQQKAAEPIVKTCERQIVRALEHAPASSPAKVQTASKSRVASRAVSKDSRLTEWQSPSGVRVAFYSRPQSPVFSVHVSALGGLRLESHAGLSNILAHTWTKGSRTRDAQAIAQATEGRAASFDGFSGRNSLGLQLTGLAKDAPELLDVLREVLLEPRFADAELEHTRRVVEDSLKSVEDHSGQLCSKLFLETLFRSHPYGRWPSGSLESVRAITAEQLRAEHQRWIHPQALTVSVSGPLSEESVRRWVDSLGASSPAGAVNGHERLTRSSLPSEPKLTAPRWVESLKDREQTHILVGGLGETVFSPDRFALRLLQNILGGQSGRLFIELREKKSLAYSVAPVAMEGLEPGYIGVYIACGAGKKDEATQGIRAVLEQLARRGPAASEIKRAREYTLGHRAMDLQTDSSLAAHYGLERLYDLPRLSAHEVRRELERVTARDIQALCDRLLVKPPMVTATVG